MRCGKVKDEKIHVSNNYVSKIKVEFSPNCTYML
jgi:hypothetical protein